MTWTPRISSGTGGPFRSGAAAAFLFAAVGITLATIKPTLPSRWVVAGVAAIVALYSQLYMSFSLGQVDATILLLVSLAFWGYTKDRPAVTGTAIAVDPDAEHVESLR
mgnify:CR=1 FL=1